MIQITSPFPAGTVQLKAGEKYNIVKGIEIGGRNFVKSGVGANPIIMYKGQRDWCAMTVTHGSVANIGAGIDFFLDPGTFAVGVQGTLIGAGSIISGGGGMFQAKGADSVNLTNWWAIGYLDWYAGYVGYAPIKDDATAFIVRPTKSVVLAHCGNRADPSNPTGHVGSRNGHVQRIHACDNFAESDCHWIDDDADRAVLRDHDGNGTHSHTNCSYVGDVDFGPLGENDGGILMPPGPKRDYYAKLSLARMNMTKCTCAAQAAKINPGILAGDIVDSSFTAHLGGSLFATPFPYMLRPASTLNMLNPTLVYRGKLNDPGRVFSGEDGAKNIRVTGPHATFNGKAYSH